MPQNETTDSFVLPARARAQDSLVRTAFERMAFTVLIGIVAGIVAGECGRLHWFLDLFSHFQLQYLFILTAPLVWFVCRKNRKAVAIAVLASGWILWRIMPLWFDDSQHTGQEPNFRLLSINVYAGNDNYDSVLELVRRTEPDIVVFQEVTGEWAAALRELSDQFPYSQVAPRPDAFGMAIYSRRPFQEVETRQVGEVPWISAVVEVEGSRFQLLAAHTLPPMGAEYSTIRNRQLREIQSAGQEAASDGLPFVVAGDLNCTPWSPYFRGLVAETGLTSARRGFGVLASWPTNRRVLSIPIDHVLMSSQFKVNDFRLGSRTGSDHRPVIADLVLGE